MTTKPKERRKFLNIRSCIAYHLLSNYMVIYGFMVMDAVMVLGVDVVILFIQLISMHLLY